MDDFTMLKQIGQRIREARLSKNMTQNDLAFAAHISTSNISDIELGKSRIWLTTFVKIVEVLQVSADSLLRSDVPEVNDLYQQEFAELLDDCTPSEFEAIMQIVQQLKITLRTQKNNDDY